MIRFNKSGFNNAEILNEYFDNIIYQYYLKNVKEKKKKLVLILDDASFHQNEVLKNKCEKEGIELLIIPGGTTSILQPLGVVVNKPLKDRLRNFYVPWLISRTEDLESLTKSGYVKPPSTNIIIDWVTKSLREISIDLTKMAFIKTGIVDDKRRNDLLDKLNIKFDNLVERLCFLN